MFSGIDSSLWNNFHIHFEYGERNTVSVREQCYESEYVMYIWFGCLLIFYCVVVYILLPIS